MVRVRYHYYYRTRNRYGNQYWYHGRPQYRTRY